MTDNINRNEIGRRLHHISFQTGNLARRTAEQNLSACTQQLSHFAVNPANLTLYILRTAQLRQLVNSVHQHMLHIKLLIQRSADHNTALLQDFFGKKRKHSPAGAGKAHSIIVILGTIHSKQLVLLRFVQHRADIFT